MRVLFITGEYPPMQGGVGDCTREIARGLGALGVAVGVVTLAQAASGEFVLRHSQAAIRKWDWSCLRAIRNAVKEFVPDIVHIQYQTGAYSMHPAINFAPRFLKSRQHKFVVTFHDLRVPYLFPKAGRVREWVTHELARSSDAVIATNDDDFAQLETWGVRRTALIPIGSNITTTPPANYDRVAWRARLGITPSETLLCYFGFLNESKGGETLIRALAQIPNAKLVLIGGQVGASDPTNVAYLGKVKALIAELGLAERVLWTDYTPPEIVTANFLAADLCVLPYRDGASYRRGTLMAALAHGCAIVTTEDNRQKAESRKQKAEGRRGLPALQNNENCLLVPPDDPIVLADAIQRAMASPELRAKIGAGARALAQFFTWDKIAQQHLDLYQQMTNPK